MSRIRTIKPEFFTSEDIVGLSPMARLLYVALWCEADREGRMLWKPRTFKMRYFPADDCSIDDMAQELLSSGLVVLYGDSYAHIPSFKRHQHINPRESNSVFPAPNDHALTTRAPRVSTRECTVTDAQGGREGKEVYDASVDALAQSRRFTPPTPQEVASYGDEIGFAIDGQRFTDFYASKGWKVGRTPMKDWRAAVRTWRRSNGEVGQAAGGEFVL